MTRSKPLRQLRRCCRKTEKMNIKKLFDKDAAKDTWAVAWRFMLIVMAMAAVVGMLYLTVKY